MKKAQISSINQKFDLQTLIIILRKMFWVIILMFILAVIGGLVFFRYTKPIYMSSSIIQIKTENRTSQLLGIGTRMFEQDLAPSVELIRSNEFLKTCIDELPLDVSYFTQGTFLSSELYQSSPFEVKYRVNNTSLLDRKILLSFLSNNKCEAIYEINNQSFKYVLGTNEWHSLFGIDLYIGVSSDYLSNTNGSNGKKDYYFTINSPSKVLNEIKNNFEIQSVNRTAGTILITFRDYNARKAAEIVNTIAEKFITFEEDRKKENISNTVKYIDEQMDLVLAQLNDSERALHEFRAMHNITTEQQNKMMENRSSWLNSVMRELEERVFELDLEILSLEKISIMLNDETNPTTIYEVLAVLSGLDSNQFFGTLLNSILSMEYQKEELLFDVTENSHRITKINQQIDNRKQIIFDLIQSTTEKLIAQQDELKQRLENFENKAFDNTVYDEIEYAKLLRIHSIHEGYYTQLIKTKAETMISQAGFITDNLILQKATISGAPEYPQFSKTMFAAILIAAVLSILIFAIKYLFYTRILSTAEISEHTDIPIIGGIPTAKLNMSVSQVIVLDRPKSMMAEAFRNIRTNLDFYPNKSKAKKIAVSSTIAGEGKTFVAINIGAIYAMTENKVVILDLDLRKPRLHKCFDVENKNGISNILIGKATYQECVQKTELDNMHFITSGPLPPNPAEIVLKPVYTNLLNELEKEYDVIIIDTPPIGIVTDALVSMKLADNPIYIMRAGISPKSFIEGVDSFKETNQVNNLGIILNSIERSNVRFGYGYKNGYGYQYGYTGYGYGYGYLTKTHNAYYGEEVEDKSIISKIKKLFISRKNI